MRLSYLRGVAALVGLSACALVVAISRAIDYGLHALFNALRPEPFLPREGFGGFKLAIPAGPSIDAATYQHNRHEAGLARLGAVRHT